MGFLLLIIFPLSTYSILVSTHEECQLLGAMNVRYWHESGLPGRAICMKTAEV